MSKEDIYNIVKLINGEFPDYDICIVGSSSLYLRDIEYKVPEDLDIVILNEEFKEMSHQERKYIIRSFIKKETGLCVDCLDLRWGEFKWDEVNLFDIKVKCILPEEYLKMKTLFSETRKIRKSKRERHKEHLEELKELVKTI